MDGIRDKRFFAMDISADICSLGKLFQIFRKQGGNVTIGSAVVSIGIACQVLITGHVSLILRIDLFGVISRQV
jgi:hypothetical protein